MFDITVHPDFSVFEETSRVMFVKLKAKFQLHFVHSPLQLNFLDCDCVSHILETKFLIKQVEELGDFSDLSKLGKRISVIYCLKKL